MINKCNIWKICYMKYTTRLIRREEALLFLRETRFQCHVLSTDFAPLFWLKLLFFFHISLDMLCAIFGLFVLLHLRIVQICGFINVFKTKCLVMMFLDLKLTVDIRVINAFTIERLNSYWHHNKPAFNKESEYGPLKSVSKID